MNELPGLAQPGAQPAPLDLAIGIALTPVLVRAYRVGLLATQPGTGRGLASYLLDGLPAADEELAAAMVLPAPFGSDGFAAVVLVGRRVQQFREDGLRTLQSHFPDPDPDPPAAEIPPPDRVRLPPVLWAYGLLADFRMYLAPPHREVWVERAGSCVYTYTV